jgi:hypothetical protein
VCPHGVIRAIATERIDVKTRRLIGLWIGLSLSISGISQELPKPSIMNSVVVSIEHSPADSAEVDLIKNTINFGLYAWPSLSVTTITPTLDWHAKLSEADKGIQAFKDQVNAFIAAAKLKNVHFHFCATSGLARILSTYKEAKEEDVRNCQWYNDNKIAADNQISTPSAMGQYIFGTLSRYARKMRANLDAKTQAMMSFLKQAFTENPETLIAVSGWGESELNYNRIDDNRSVQESFCDYSPLAILEFRDWLQHTGLYDDANGKYKGQGYKNGGAKYQGDAGRIQFNSDFGTAFTTWNLKYFNWSLADDYDLDPTDDVNNDPHRIPIASYTHGGMMPASGPNFTADGFDPPRTMAPGSAFWDLWNFFRETMVGNFVRDAASAARDAGIGPFQWFSHQVPADYLFGTNPDMSNKNARYYTSASPLWTTDVSALAAPGATIYDVKFPTWFARTSRYALEALSKLAVVWAVMEYDAESYPQGLGVSPSDAGYILDQFMNVYNYGPSFINFWRWIDTTGESQIKGTNKGTALRTFVQQIRDKAKSKDLTVVYAPPQVIDFSGTYAAGENASDLKLSGKIWTGEKWEWKDWGDFSKFEIYKGTSPNVPVDADHLLASTSATTYRDTAVAQGTAYYYKIRAVNSRNVAGPASQEIMISGYPLTLSATPGGTTDPAPGVYMYAPNAAVTVRALPENDYDFVNWSGDAIGNQNPLSLTMNAAKDITANFLKSGPFAPLNLTGIKKTNRSLTQGETFLILNWEPNPRNRDIVKYRIYFLDGADRHLQGEARADAVEYTRRGVAKDKEYVCGIAAVSELNIESQLATVTVK